MRKSCYNLKEKTNYHKISDYSWSSGEFISLKDKRYFLNTGGSYGVPGLFKQIQSKAYLYDIDKNKILKLPQMILERENQEMSLLNNGKVLITGGKTNKSITNTAEIFIKK